MQQVEADLGKGVVVLVLAWSLGGPKGGHSGGFGQGVGGKSLD
jgi:hypothetical protein